MPTPWAAITCAGRNAAAVLRAATLAALLLPRPGMKRIDAIIKPFKLDEVKELGAR